jgi:hypothetical protein
MSNRLISGEEPGERSRQHNPMARPGQDEPTAQACRLSVRPWPMRGTQRAEHRQEGASALAIGGNFCVLRRWSDAEWQAARERIEAENTKDKATR